MALRHLRYSYGYTNRTVFTFCSSRFHHRLGSLVSLTVLLSTVDGTSTQAVASLAAVGGIWCRSATISKTMCFLTDMSTFGEFNDAYVAAFGDHRPARSAIGVALPLMAPSKSRLGPIPLRASLGAEAALSVSELLIPWQAQLRSSRFLRFPRHCCNDGGVATRFSAPSALLESVASRAVNCSISTTESSRLIFVTLKESRLLILY